MKIEWIAACERTARLPDNRICMIGMYTDGVPFAEANSLYPISIVFTCLHDEKDPEEQIIIFKIALPKSGFKELGSTTIRRAPSGRTTVTEVSGYVPVSERGLYPIYLSLPGQHIEDAEAVTLEFVPSSEWLASRSSCRYWPDPPSSMS